MRRRISLVIVIALCATVMGCGGNKASRFYRLSATAEVPSSDVMPMSARTIVLIDPIVVPDYVKRAPIVVRVGESELKVEEFHRWISDLEQNVREVLREELSRRCPGAAITLSPWVAPDEAALRVGIAIDTFELTEDEQAVIVARWAMTSGSRNWSKPHDFRMTAPTGVDPKEKGYDGRVAALSALIADLSEEIAVVVNHAIADS